MHERKDYVDDGTSTSSLRSCISLHNEQGSFTT